MVVSWRIVKYSRQAFGQTRIAWQTVWSRWESWQHGPAAGSLLFEEMISSTCFPSLWGCSDIVPCFLQKNCTWWYVCLRNSNSFQTTVCEDFSNSIPLLFKKCTFDVVCVKNSRSLRLSYSATVVISFFGFSKAVLGCVWNAKSLLPRLLCCAVLWCCLLEKINKTNSL